MKVTKIDENLKQYANARTCEFIDAINTHGSMHKAAAAVGCSQSTISRSISMASKEAAMRGYSPEHDMVRTVPAPFIVKGVSTYYDKEGKPSGQWVKSRLSDEAFQAAVREGVAEFVASQAPIEAPDEPRDYSTDVIPWIQIGDAHIGMLAHAGETGESFDVKIAERELCGAISMLIDEMPACERVVVNDLGDFTHYENFSATTEASGHPLDFDSRFPKMIKSYSRIMRFIVDKALTKAKFVDIIINQGNHSRTNDIWMAELLRVGYGHTGRVNVLNNDSVFIAYRMGKTLVMIHHSDKSKPAHLVGVMTTDFRKDFGDTEFHYIDIGHVHHHFVSREHPSVVIESWNHLAASDKWAHDAGYRSRKAISVVLRSKTYGEIGRRLLPIQEVRDRLHGVGMATPKGKEVFSV